MTPRDQMVWLTGMLLMGGPLALAAEGATGGPVVREAVAADVYTLEGGFDVAATPRVVWDVLTDYDHMPHFVPSVLTSVAEPLMDGGGLMLRQQFEGKVFVFSRDVQVRLEVHEQPQRHISFRDVSLQDFDVYQGSWNIQEIPGGTRVDYSLRAKPRSAFPEVLAKGAFKSSAAQMLVQLRDEMLRREAPRAPSGQGDAPPKAGRP